MLDSDATDIAQLSETQGAHTGPLAERIRQAGEWLGGRFDWTPQLAWKLEQLPLTLTPVDQGPRLSCGTIDAIFADHQ